MNDIKENLETTQRLVMGVVTLKIPVSFSDKWRSKMLTIIISRWKWGNLPLWNRSFQSNFYSNLILFHPQYFFGQITTYPSVIWSKFMLHTYVWNLILYPLEVWLKFKLFNYGLESNDASVSQDFFSLVFLCFFVFLEERDIKVEQNYIFSLVFNRGGLWNPNWANLK